MIFGILFIKKFFENVWILLEHLSQICDITIMRTTKKITNNAVKILHKRYVKGDKRRLESLMREREKLDIAGQIYQLRIKAGLTQNQLAKMIGTTQSVISRLEDADYDGHSINILGRIARALHCKIEIHLVPEKANYAYV
jgi:DNA-binding XRE family transcriptional regulator